jgi:hypothetical protein
MSEIQELLTRFWSDLLARPSGPLALRFLVQPIVATILAVRDGLKDARGGRSPYFWTLVADPARRRASLRDGLRSVGKIIVLAFILDAIYQFTLGEFYPVEALVVAVALGVLPYLLFRGPVARLARRRRRGLSA